MADDSSRIKGLIREIPDFPQPGISFKDITTLLQDPAGLKTAIDAMVRPFRPSEVGMVVGIESRGFVVGTPMCCW